MSEERQNYEVAFHINPNIEESQVPAIRAEIEDVLTKHGAIITFSREPEKTSLSYELKKQRASYFGYTQFSTNPLRQPAAGGLEELLPALQENLKMQPNILRSIVIKLPSDAQKNKAMMHQMKMKERMERKPKVEASKPVTPEEQEKMEEQLEEVIEKL